MSKIDSLILFDAHINYIQWHCAAIITAIVGNKVTTNLRCMWFTSIWKSPSCYFYL